MGLFRGGSHEPRDGGGGQDGHQPSVGDIEQPDRQLLQPTVAENMGNGKPRWRSSKQPECNQDAKDHALKRRTSRLSLFGMFNKNKPVETEVKQEKLRTPLEEDEDVEYSATEVSERNDSTTTMPTDVNPLPIPDTPAIPLRHRSSKGALRTKASFKKEINLRRPSLWDPPPLFQAYPQAVKHSTLSSPDMSTEAILRLYCEKPTASRRPSSSDGKNERKDSKDKKLKRSSPSDVLSACDWVDKTFVLVTSGYFLQYAGDGTYDRLPEKVMSLNKDSAAFASDAIPGKHFVLQVSQLSDEDGTVDLDASRSVFKKISLRGDIRRSVSSFLLVLKSPEELSEWIVAVRREIEALGGKEYRPDELRKHPMLEPSEQLHRGPSHRFLVTKRPLQQQGNPYERFPGPGLGDEHADDDDQPETRMPEHSAPKRQSLATQESADSRYVSDTTASIDQIHLDRLRESPRQSFASTGGKTTSTSRDSSLERSPVNRKARSGSNTTDDDIWAMATYPGTALVSLEESPRAVTAGRESLQATPTPPSRPTSNGTSSPPATNFSVPSFSKRYSTAASPVPHTGMPSYSVNVLPESVDKSIIDTETSRERKRMTRSSELHSRSRSRNGSRQSSSPQQLSAWPPPSAPPKSSGSSRPPSSSEGDRSFSRRFSSLEYSRGVSPVHARHSPSPHPPPTTALPPIPQGGDAMRRGSLIPPPSGPLPALPSTMPSLGPSFGPPTTSLPPLPHERPTSAHATSAKRSLSQDRKLRRPVSMQVRSKATTAPDPMPSPTAVKNTFHAAQTPPTAPHLLPSSMPSPPKPTRNPPAPPQDLSPKSLAARKNTPDFAYSSSSLAHDADLPLDAMSRISIISPLASPQQESAPHPFIPPIKISERRKSRGSGGSLDGPWLLDYTAPKRNFMDLSV